MGKKKVTDEEILLAYANPELKQVKDIAASLGIKQPSLWARVKKIKNFEERLLEIIQEATVIIAAAGFKEMARIISSDSRFTKDKDRIAAFKLILQYRGELTETRKLIGDDAQPVLVKIVREIIDNVNDE